MTFQFIKSLYTVVCLCYFASVATTQTGQITVQVEGIKNKPGKIALLLFNQAQGFPGEVSRSLRQELKNAQAGELRFVLDKLPYGSYAISLMHDENENRKIDTNLLGIPKEGYGFSNNAKNLFRAPRFKEAEFTLDKPMLNLTIKLVY